MAGSWTVVIPVKRTAIAKSRLAGGYPLHRADLAHAFAIDTTAAALATPAVIDVLVITDDSAVSRDVRALGATVVADEPDAGLNPALAHAALQAPPSHGVAALSADLPALRPAELAATLAAAAPGRSFVVDLAGTGTTLLAATAGVALDPRFGPGSARAHLLSGAAELDLPGIESVRRDVDTAADLAHAVRLGVGRQTADLLSLVLGAATGTEAIA